MVELGERLGMPEYAMGYDEAVTQIYGRYTAETGAAHLLPHLRPGFRVLDLGCGVGSISVGLAQAVAPGELHGIDMDPSIIELARQKAQDCRQDNAIFQVGDATELQFEDCCFDAVYCNNLLMYVPDTCAALGEAKRVLKPGGLIACREMILGSSFSYPDFDDMMGKSYEIYEDLLTSDDGHPNMGRELKHHLHQAGYENINITAAVTIYSSPQDLEFIYNLVNDWFLSHEIVDAALKYGATTKQISDRIRIAYDQWLEHPGALTGIAYGMALAVKPDA